MFSIKKAVQPGRKKIVKRRKDIRVRGERVRW